MNCVGLISTSFCWKGHKMTNSCSFFLCIYPFQLWFSEYFSWYTFEPLLSSLKNHNSHSDYQPCPPCRFRAGADVQWLVGVGEPPSSSWFQASTGGELWHLPKPDQKTKTITAKDGHWHRKWKDFHLFYTVACSVGRVTQKQMNLNALCALHNALIQSLFSVVEHWPFALFIPRC